jgi:hypothetical protein
MVASRICIVEDVREMYVQSFNRSHNRAIQDEVEDGYRQLVFV